MKAKLRVEVGSCGQQYGVMPKEKKKYTVNAVLALTLLKNNQKGQRYLHCAFGLDLESDRLSRKQP